MATVIIALEATAMGADRRRLSLVPAGANKIAILV